MRGTNSRKEGQPGFFRPEKKMSTGYAGKRKSTAPAPVSGFKELSVIQRLGITNMKLDDYLADARDRTDLVRVKPVGILGKKQHGLFAAAPIKKGTVLGKYTGKRFTLKEFKQHLAHTKGATQHYAMEVGNTITCSQQQGNFTRYVNCSTSQPSSAFVQFSTASTVLKAIRDIPEGAQILVDYGTLSKHQLFLNPEDGPLSTVDMYIRDKRHYGLKASKLAAPSVGLSLRDNLYVTELLWWIMQNRPITELHCYEPAEVDMPCLRATKEGIVKPAAQFENEEPFTPLMLACYLGQLENVQFLIQNGASVNRQQHLSGQCPLFCALDGYEQSCNEMIKHRYYLIIIELLAHQALPSCHDPKCRTFLQKASLVLHPGHLRNILAFFAKNGPAIEELYNYLDNSEQDALMSCLAERNFDNLAELLAFAPTYFTDHLQPQIKQNKAPYHKKLQDILTSFTQEEIHTLFYVLSRAPIENLDLSALQYLAEQNAQPSTMSI